MRWLSVPSAGDAEVDQPGTEPQTSASALAARAVPEPFAGAATVAAGPVAPQAGPVCVTLTAAGGEPHRLGRWATIKIIFQCDGHSLRHLTLPCCDNACTVHRPASTAATATPQIRAESQDPITQLRTNTPDDRLPALAPAEHALSAIPEGRLASEAADLVVVGS